MAFTKLSTVSVNERKKCLVKSGKDTTNFFDFELSGYLAKYVEILGKVCGHTGNGV